MAKSNIKYINDDEAFEAAMSSASAPEDVVVVDIFTTWCGPCKAVEPLVIALAKKYPRVIFLKVDADKCFDTAMKHNVVSIPLFVIYANQQKVCTYQGIQIEALDTKIAELISAAEKLHVKPSNQEPEEEIADGIRSVAQSNPNLRRELFNKKSNLLVEDLSAYVDEAGCQCVNDLAPSSFDGFLGGKKLVSGKGSGKLLLHYVFTQKLMLHSFSIKAHAETGPKVMKLFINHPQLLDFAIGAQLTPSQEVTLNPSDLEGDKLIQFRPGSFNLVTSLQILITEAMVPTLSYNRVEIDSLTFYGSPVLTHHHEEVNKDHSMTQTQKTSSHNNHGPSSHKTKAADSETPLLINLNLNANIPSPSPSPLVSSKLERIDEHPDDEDVANVLKNITFYHGEEQNEEMIEEDPLSTPFNPPTKITKSKSHSSKSPIRTVDITEAKDKYLQSLKDKEDDKKRRKFGSASLAKETMYLVLEQQQLAMARREKSMSPGKGSKGKNKKPLISTGTSSGLIASGGGGSTSIGGIGSGQAQQQNPQAIGGSGGGGSKRTKKKSSSKKNKTLWR